MRSVIGGRVERPDGPGKVNGRALYVADLELPVAGLWYGGVLRSSVAHGTYDADATLAWEGLDAAALVAAGELVILGARDLPAENVVAMIADDQPLLCAGQIRHVGEPLALIAAPTRAGLERALAAAAPREHALTPTLDFEASAEEQHALLIEKGDAPAVLRDAERVIEGVYRTDSQEQMYIETQGCMAWPADESGEVRIIGSLQCPHYVQRAVARALGIAPDKARVIQAETGGGFGGKEDYPSVLASQAALLAARAGHPVSMIMDRHEDLAFTPKRHISRVIHRTAVGERGELLALDIDVLLDGGAYITLSPVVLSRACIHAAGPYRCDNVRIRGRVVATHHVPAGAFRGFGAPQTCFAIERQMDAIARELDIHPYALRRANALQLGDTTATSQVLKESVGSMQVLERLKEVSAFDRHSWRAPQTGHVRRGLGMSFFFHGAGFTGAGEDLLRGKIQVELQADGRPLVRAGSTEFGQGTLTMFCAIAAEALGAEPDAVDIAPADTGLVPNSGPTVASRTCMIMGGCLERACRELRARMEASAEPGSNAADFCIRARAFLAAGGAGVVSLTYSSPPGLKWDEKLYRGDAYPAFGWAADLAEVEVDLDTFDVRITNFLSCVDVGHALQPQMVEGQIEGGGLQALGFAHLEAVSFSGGRVMQDRMATCIIPTSLDAPPMRTEIIEVPFSGGPFGAKGVGELPMDGGGPAVAAAIEDATGIIVERLPATPERLMEAWLRMHPEEELSPEESR